MVSSPAVIAIAILVLVVGGTLAFALSSVRRIKMDPQQYMVGGRSFGTIFLWVLLAGEIYTSFTFLGLAGWAYGMGAPTYYILAYGPLAYIFAYFLLPRIYRVSKERGLLTAADFFADRYRSKSLGIVVAAIYFVLLVPYVTLQLSGLQTLLRVAGYGSINATAAVAIAFVVIALFTFVAGLRGTAWASIVKDAFVLGAIIFAGVAITIQFFGSPAGMIDQLLRAHPHWLTLDAPTAPHGTIWYVSTVLLTSLAFFMGPQSFAAVYSSRSENAIRRNAMYLPVYNLLLMFMFFAGLSALLIAPGLKGPAVDQSFLLVVQRYYPPWVMGCVAAAGALAALIPATALLLAASSIFTKNVLGAFGIATSDAPRTLATRMVVVVVAVLALVLWMVFPSTLVGLLLVYYNGVAQFLPATVAALAWPRVTLAGACAGIGTGLGLVIVLTVLNLPLAGFNAGFIALIANATALVVVSLVTPRSAPRRDEGSPYAASPRDSTLQS